MRRPPTYYAHLILQDGTKIEFNGKNYEKVVAKLDRMRHKIMKNEEYWPAGLVQSFR